MLLDYQESHHGPTILLVQSHSGARRLTEMIPSVKSFPYVEMQASDTSNPIPSLNWHKPAIRNFIGQFLNTSGWLQVSSLLRIVFY